LDNETIDEDITALEDKPDEERQDSVIVQFVEAGLPPGTPVYRLRLAYSNEAFLAAWNGGDLEPGSMVLVSTRYGRDLAQVSGPVRCPVPEVIRIERPATAEDLERARSNKSQEDNALRVCRTKIEKLRLEMKLVSVHYLLEEPKILFFFTADNRVDFRELVHDLVAVFHTRIELRQIGVRDEARTLGGLGVCGRGYCCHMISDKLKPVSIKMAKDQNLSLNSMKISGPCGRLLCCLAYEHSFYSEQRRILPQEGTRLFYDGTNWKVTEVNIASGRITLNAEEGRVLILPFCRFEKSDNRWIIT
jgi:cell fate regulator YaaT (PSP1 superfamily)